MVLAIEIHRRNDDLLFRSDAVMNRCDLFSEQARNNLRMTGQVFVDEVRKAGLASKQVIDEAANQFSTSMCAALAKDEEMRVDLYRQLQALAKERKDLEKFKADLNSRPLWRRLVLAVQRKY